jgi:hypothetical protein
MVKKSCGQTVYVPGTAAEMQDAFTFTRAIFRNVDPDKAVTITSLAGYNNEGDFIEEFLEEPVPVEPWHSYSAIRMIGSPYAVPPYVGRPFFILEWEANGKVITPNITGQVIDWGGPDTNSPGIRNSVFVPGIVIEERWYCGNKGKKD